MGLLEQGLGLEVGSGIERSGWEMWFASLGLWVTFLHEGPLAEVGEEVADCLLVAWSRPLTALL
jgi:hypothetical protein